MTSTTTLTAPTGRTTRRSAAGSHLWRTGAGAGLSASVATAAFAALAHAVGVSLKFVIPALASRPTD